MTRISSPCSCRLAASAGGATAIACGAACQRCSKDSRSGSQLALNPAILAGLGCYGLSVVVWIMALSRVEVSVAYPMLSLGYVVNALFAWWLFGEALTAMRLSGMFLIIVGVYLVARS